MKKRIILDLNNVSETAKVSRALSSEARVKILQILTKKSCNISELANLLQLPVSTIANHVQILEDAELISTTERPGLRGSQKVCGISFEDVYLSSVITTENKSERRYIVPMSIGNYFDCEINKPCGLVSEKSYLGTEDSPAVFFDNNRTQAQLLWFHSGYIEYRFPLSTSQGEEIVGIDFSFELCSEAPGYNNNWPSDIDLHVDNKYCGTVYSLGDYGGTRGVLNPDWWSDYRTQYGILHSLQINRQNSFIDGEISSAITIADLNLKRNYLALRFTVREDAQNVGGLNLFGEKFGNHAQNIVMGVTSKKL